MTTDEQLKRLYKIIEEIRILQENGLWEPLQRSKELIYKITKEIENLETTRKGKGL